MSPPLPRFPFQWTLNPGYRQKAAYGPRQSAVLNRESLEAARRCISAWPGYKPTPLVELPGLAGALQIDRLWYKNEAERFGLRSFKPLGGAYAVQQCLLREVAERTGRDDVDPRELLDGTHKAIVSQVTVTAATDGNHGRSVAWGASMFGCRCVIYINEAVTVAREEAIAAYGAEVRRNPGSYDDAVREAFAVARRESWHVIPDTPGAELGDSAAVTAARDVTQGYAVMAAEILDQLEGGPLPTHVFLQAGVGGMAAAVCGTLWEALSDARPQTILVEPEQCACWLASLNKQTPTAITGDTDSFMSGLACGEVSRLAWEILQPGAAAAMALPDAAAAEAMRLLAAGIGDDPPLVAGESGVAGVAALIAMAQDAQAREQLGLDETAHVLLFCSEGATDEAMYEQVVGRPWREVAA
ncbi:MAG: diaminopropionate ammonia-lyase [Kiloniellaceae bacterium]